MAEILMAVLAAVLGAAFLIQLAMMLLILVPDYLKWSTDTDEGDEQTTDHR